jgi:alpha-amylase
LNEVTLILCIHNHQPVGNLPGVFESAYRDAYLPFLEAVERFPEIRIVLHNTGPLLEWYEEHAPDYLERVARLVARGQVEVLTGGFYEPILCAIPERDALGQIAMMTEYVESAFRARPRGMWLAERVWEPHLARTIARAGVEYVPLDDYEFRLAGLPDDDLVGRFVTEDQGRALSVFPISKRLRYSIPFAEPSVTIDHLRSLGERAPGLCAVFGDDGEKFGVWPGTRAHVHEGGWLDRFFSALLENRDWLRTRTFAEFVDREPARGRTYLPASSYPEMMEWALPTPARREYERLMRELGEKGLAEAWGPFLSGGVWRGFLAKYDEANVMARKMLRVSGKVADAERALRCLAERNELEEAVRTGGAGEHPPVDPEAVRAAMRELWMGQCNCAYWHGVFGGLYLPHLRSAIYEHLIRAENLLEQTATGRWDRIDVLDHDLDGDEEVILESSWANAYVAPARGGTIFELDLRRAATNALATMSRYEEAYHAAVSEANPCSSGGDGVASIHDAVTVKEEGLSRLVVPDGHPRRAAVDRFLPPGTRRHELERGTACDVGDFAGGRYDFEPFRVDGRVGVSMRREGNLGEAGACAIEKTVWLDPGGALRVEYRVRPTRAIDLLFAPEWNLALLTDNEEFVFVEAGDSGPVSAGARTTHDGPRGVRVTDRLKGVVLTIEPEPACPVWAYPLETASQSEGGLERVFQGTTFVPAWRLDLEAGVEARLGVTLRAESLGG